MTDKEKIEILKNAIAGLIGEDRIESLYSMKDMLTMSYKVKPNNDIAAAIIAINALIMVLQDEKC